MPSTHEAESIHISNNWIRLAFDVTHYHNGAYLSIVDYVPSRITIWQKLSGETGDNCSFVKQAIL